MNSHFFAFIISEQLLLLQSETSTEQPLLQNRELSGQLPFETATFLVEELFRKKDIYRRATFSKQVILHIINFSRKAIFWKKLIIQKSNTLYYLLLLESCFFRAATASKDTTFYSLLLFRRFAFLQDTFSEALIFHSYTSFPQLYYLHVCQ